MSKIAVIFGIPEPAFDMGLRRLRRLINMNPELNFFPIIGPRQLIHFPMVIDQFMFGSSKRIPIIGYVSHTINWLALSAPGIFPFSKAINKKSLDVIKKNKLKEMETKLNCMIKHSSYIDYTPLALWNLDHCIMSWYENLGRTVDFDYVVFYESDIFTTKPIDEIYEKYTKKYDACFADFEIANKDWHFYNYPFGSRKATKKWLEKRMLPTKLYKSIFAGAIISRRCLERLRELKIDFSGAPYCQNEMRLPSLLSALGFKCGKLDFPFVRYRPEVSIDTIISNKDEGIFHPVKKLVISELQNLTE